MLWPRSLQHARKALTTLRHISACAPHSLSAERSIYVSKSTNPYFNLTLEDWSVRSAACSSRIAGSRGGRKAVQTQVAEGAAAAAVQGRPVCRHRAQPEPVEGGQPARRRGHAYAVDPAAQRRWDGVPCTYQSACER